MGLWDDEVQDARSSAVYQQAKRLSQDLASVESLEGAVEALDAAAREFPALADSDADFKRWRAQCITAGRALRSRAEAEWQRFAEAHREFAASLDGPPPGWARCEVISSGFGFRFHYPAEWRLREDSDDGRAMVTPAPGAPENFNVIMKSLPYVPSIEQHAATSIEKLRFDVPGVNILERRFRRVGKSDAYELAFAAQELKGTQIYALAGNVAYTLTALAPEQKHKELAPLLEQIVDSFETISR